MIEILKTHAGIEFIARNIHFGKTIGESPLAIVFCTYLIVVLWEEDITLYATTHHYLIAFFIVLCHRSKREREGNDR